MRLLITLATVLLLSSCNPTSDRQSNSTDWSFVGSWYTDLKDGGAYDSTINYGEIYVNDTSLFYYEERFGQMYDQSYFIKNDTIFTCFGTGNDCEYIPMLKIEDFKNDTLWLIVNKEYSKKTGTQVYFVKFPKDEKGHYEHNWTKENTDSLRWAVQYDYDRRKFKFYATLWDNLDAYDSALKAGTWKWDMDERHIREDIERRRKRAE